MSIRINKKIFIIILLVIILLISLKNNVYASTDWNTVGLKDIIGGAQNFTSIGEKEIKNDPGIEDSSMKTASNMVYNVFLILGMAVAVIMGIVMGIKFMTGTIDEKADIKNSLIPYIAGCIVVFGAFAIWKLVLNILQGIPS